MIGAMAGKVFLGGGGSAQQERSVWTAMLTGNPSIVYWPMAQDEDMQEGAETWLRDSLDTLGAPRLPITTWTTFEGHSSEDLWSFDLLLISGGNTFRLLKTVREHGWLAPIRTFVCRGKDLYGGSAGAILTCDDIAVAHIYDANDVGLDDVSALGLLPRVALLPHYEREAEQRMQRWCRDHDRTMLALPEAYGLVIDGEYAEVLGPEPAWLLTDTSAREHPMGTRLAIAAL
jgi:dipeptidase E